MTPPPFSKKRSQLRKFLYAAAAVILLGSLLASHALGSQSSGI